MAPKAWRAIAFACLVAGYVMGAVWGARLGIIQEGAVTTLWPPAGIALAGILLLGFAALPVVVLADLLASLVLGIGAFTAVPLAFVTSIEPAVATLVLHRLSFDRTLARFRDVLALVAAGAIVGPLASAVPGTLVLYLGGQISMAGIGPATVAWWIADALAVLIVAPPILVFAQRPRVWLHRGRAPEAAALAGLALLTAMIVFGDLDTPFPDAAVHLLLPFFLWAAARFYQHGASAMGLLVAAVAIQATTAGRGPFAGTRPDAALVALQAFVATHATTALALAAVLREQRAIDEEVRRYRDRLALLVQDRTRELETTNRELEAFSFTVSHDLRAPLRALGAMAATLEEDHADALGPDGREAVVRMRREARRMTQLVEDLMALARITGAEVVRARTDVSRLAREVVAQLRERQPREGVDVRIEDGLVARADPHLVRVVLENLLSNAWKYTSRTPSPRIEVGMRADADDGAVFFVRDNGVGFDMARAEKLFMPFQRLHGGEFEGTGIGLATVKRVVMRHGGRVWVEAAPERGATFYFTLGPRQLASGTDPPEGVAQATRRTSR